MTEVNHQAIAVASGFFSKLLEKRRKLMEAWASYCEPKTRSNVVQMRKA